jgi:hypothetical protein
MSSRNTVAEKQIPLPYSGILLITWMVSSFSEEVFELSISIRDQDGKILALYPGGWEGAQAVIQQNFGETDATLGMEREGIKSCFNKMRERYLAFATVMSRDADFDSDLLSLDELYEVWERFNEPK